MLPDVHDDTFAPELERIRVALRERLEERGNVRSVAGEAGVSDYTLANFLAGGTPIPLSIARLRDWYEAWRKAGGLSAEDVREMLLTMLRGLPTPATGVLPALDAFERIYRENGATPPAWIAELRARCRS
jgi:hypothetical protein